MVKWVGIKQWLMWTKCKEKSLKCLNHLVSGSCVALLDSEVWLQQPCMPSILLENLRQIAGGFQWSHWSYVIDQGWWCLDPLSTSTSTPSCLLTSQGPRGGESGQRCLGTLRSSHWPWVGDTQKPLLGGFSSSFCDHVMYHAAPVDLYRSSPWKGHCGTSIASSNLQVSHRRIRGGGQRLQGSCRGCVCTGVLRPQQWTTEGSRLVFGWLLLPSSMRSGMPWYHVMTFVGVDIVDLPPPLTQDSSHH